MCVVACIFLLIHIFFKYLYNLCIYIDYIGCIYYTNEFVLLGFFFDTRISNPNWRFQQQQALYMSNTAGIKHNRPAYSWEQVCPDHAALDPWANLGTKVSLRRLLLERQFAVICPRLPKPKVLQPQISPWRLPATRDLLIKRLLCQSYHDRHHHHHHHHQ